MMQTYARAQGMVRTPALRWLYGCKHTGYTFRKRPRESNSYVSSACCACCAWPQWMSTSEDQGDLGKHWLCLMQPWISLTSAAFELR